MHFQLFRKNFKCTHFRNLGQLGLNEVYRLDYLNFSGLVSVCKLSWCSWINHKFKLILFATLLNRLEFLFYECKQRKVNNFARGMFQGMGIKWKVILHSLAELKNSLNPQFLVLDNVECAVFTEHVSEQQWRSFITALSVNSAMILWLVKSTFACYALGCFFTGCFCFGFFCLLVCFL